MTALLLREGGATVWLLAPLITLSVPTFHVKVAAVLLRFFCCCHDKIVNRCAITLRVNRCASLYPIVIVAPLLYPVVNRYAIIIPDRHRCASTIYQIIIANRCAEHCIGYRFV